MRMFSKVLNRNIKLEDGASIDIDDARDVANEVGSNLIKLNAKLKIVQNRARRQAEEKTLKEWEILTNARADLAALHQTLLKRISAANKQEKEVEAKRRQEGKTFADHFKDVVRCEANRVDYQRWILQAKMRYKASQFELARD